MPGARRIPDRGGRAGRCRAPRRPAALTRNAVVAALLALAGLPLAAGPIGEPPGTIVHGRFELRPSPPTTPGPAPEGEIGLILDDGGQEAAFGVTSGVGAAQFLWFNRFQAVPGLALFHLQEIRVLFPGGAGLRTGDAIQLVIYHDADDDPATGAELLATRDEVIQIADDTTFSRYPIDPPIAVRGEASVILGVVNRWVETGVSPPVSPASLDLDRPQGRSWFATWTGDPPDPPLLPPDGVLARIDEFEPGAAGNWMIRGFGTRPDAVEVPTLGRPAAAAFALLLLGAGLLRLTRAAGRPI